MPRLPWGMAATGALVTLLLISASVPLARPDDDTQSRIIKLDPALGLEVAALQYVLTQEEMAELLSIGNPDGQRAWIDEYWDSRNPILTSDENRIRIEHDRRVAFALDNFRLFEWPGWDHRGIVHIRFGHPANRSVIPAEAISGNVQPAREIWYYPDYEMKVMFEDALGRGNFEKVTFSARGSGATVSFKTDQAIDAQLDKGDGMGAISPDHIERVSPDDGNMTLARYDEIVEKTPSLYPSDFDHNQLPFYFGVKRFRGGESIDRVDVNIEFVADLSPRFRKQNIKTFTASAVCWDTNGNEVGRDDQHIELPTVAEPTETTRMFPAQLRFSMPPDFYHVAVTVEEQNSDRFASYSQEIRCPDFEHGLAVSDIIFASRIEEATGDSPFNRGPLVVVPHPFARYQLNSSMPVYFEVYNLAAQDGGLANYTVAYEIVSKAAKKRGFWGRLFGKEGSPQAISASFQGSSRSSEDYVNLAIALDNLWAGEFDLRVTITDNRTREEAGGEATFYIVEGE